jgi:GNAT superfamily N-acetyltransferase
MDRSKTLARYDHEMRQDPPIGPDESVERSPELVRVVGPRGWIAYSHLTPETAAACVEREADTIRRRGVPVEWKLYEHDGPPSLAALLAENGFVPDPPETLMAVDLNDRLDFGRPPDRVTVELIVDPAGLEEAGRVSKVAFGPGDGWDVSEYLLRLGSPELAIFLARVDGVPAAAGRLDLPIGRSFASLWGGGTTPQFRGRGVYRALVAARAEVARSRGFQYLTVDALETSRPILERVGFQPLSRVVGWVLTPGAR